MSKERELLKRLLENFERPVTGRFGDLFDEVRVFLSTPEPTQDDEPVAWMFFSKVGSLHYHTSEQQALKGLRMHGGKKVIALYERPTPRPEFVRLSEEEIVSWWGVATEAGLIEFARAIEDALKEKNRG